MNSGTSSTAGETAMGGTCIQAGRNLNLTAGQATQTLDESHQKKESGSTSIY